MKALATVLGIGMGVGSAFGMVVVSPEPQAPLLGGLLAFVSVLYLAAIADMRHL
jgi:hypothetical protein